MASNSAKSDKSATGPGTDPDALAAPDPHADVAAMPYEAARDELSSIVSRLESGQVGLEESMGLWERGEALAAHCAGWLDAVEAKLNASAPSASTSRSATEAPSAD